MTISSLDETQFQIFAPNQTAMDEAKERIEELLKEDVEHTLEFGAIYQSTIVELKDFGVLVQLFPGMPPALVHLTQLDSRKVGIIRCMTV